MKRATSSVRQVTIPSKPQQMNDNTWTQIIILQRKSQIIS